MGRKKKSLTDEELKIFLETFDKNKLVDHIIKELKAKGVTMSYNFFKDMVRHHFNLEYDGRKKKWIPIKIAKNKSVEEKKQDTSEESSIKSENKEQIQNTLENSESTSDIGQVTIAALESGTSSFTPSFESPISPVQEPSKLLKNVEAILQKLERLAKIESDLSDLKIQVKHLTKKDTLENQKIDEQIKDIMRMYAGDKIKKSVSINKEVFNLIKTIMPQVCPVNSSNDSAIIDAALFMTCLLMDPSVRKKNIK